MRVFGSWRFCGSASLLTAAVVIWVGVFLLSWPSSGSEGYSAFSMVEAPHAEQPADGHQIEGNYLAVFAEEDEAWDELPKNARPLRALVYLLFFGLAFVWLGVCGWKRRRPQVCSPISYPFHSVVCLHQRRSVATLLGVFRL
jgi:hypothetical protein